VTSGTDCTKQGAHLVFSGPASCVYENIIIISFEMIGRLKIIEKLQDMNPKGYVVES